jgi:hypothetical protein
MISFYSNKRLFWGCTVTNVPFDLSTVINVPFIVIDVPKSLFYAVLSASLIYKVLQFKSIMGAKKGQILLIEP